MTLANLEKVGHEMSKQDLQVYKGSQAYKLYNVKEKQIVFLWSLFHVVVKKIKKNSQPVSVKNNAYALEMQVMTLHHVFN